MAFPFLNQIDTTPLSSSGPSSCALHPLGYSLVPLYLRSFCTQRFTTLAIHFLKDRDGSEGRSYDYFCRVLMKEKKCYFPFLKLVSFFSGLPAGQLWLVHPLQLRPSLHCHPEALPATEGFKAEAAGPS